MLMAAVARSLAVDALRQSNDVCRRLFAFLRRKSAGAHRIMQQGEVMLLGGSPRRHPDGLHLQDTGDSHFLAATAEEPRGKAKRPGPARDQERSRASFFRKPAIASGG